MNAEGTLANIKHIARTLMASKGMPSLVINAPRRVVEGTA